MKAFWGAAALSAALGACLPTGSAQAQVYFDTWSERWGPRIEQMPRDLPYERYSDERPLDRGELRALLTRRGYRVATMSREADTWSVEAVDPAGRRLTLIIDPYDGTILRRFEGATPRGRSREELEERWLEGDDRALPPRAPRPPAQAQPRSQPRTNAPQAAPKAAPKTAPTPPPAPAAPVAPAAIPPAPATPQAAEPAPAPQTQTTPPRVIPLYNKPEEAKPPE